MISVVPSGGKTIHEEASTDTRTFDVVEAIRARRLKWVGHIFRMDSTRLIQKVLRFIHANRTEGDLLMDVPDIPWNALQALARDRQLWRQHARAKFAALWPSEDTQATSTPPRRTHTSDEVKHTQSPMARRYVQRDRHVAFFKPYSSLSKAHLKQKRDRQRKLYNSRKNKLAMPKSAKESYAELQLEHELQHLEPEILGHACSYPTHDPSLTNNNNTLLPPIHMNDLFDYLNDLSYHHENLKNLP